MEGDENHDGVLTLDEFQVLMKKMLEREKQAEAEAEESKGRAPEGQEKIV